MSHEAKVCLTIGEGGEKYVVSGIFEDQEWKVLHDFVKYTNDLRSIELVRQGGPGKLNISYTQESGLSYSVDLPKEDQILALLHRLRPFVLQNELTNFYRVCNHLSRRFDDAPFRGFIKSIGDYYSGKKMQAIILLRSNDVLINSEEILLKWLNAHEYHRDNEKQAELDTLHKILPLETSRAIFVMMLYDKVRAITILSNFISVIVGEQETFRYTLR